MTAGIKKAIPPLLVVVAGAAVAYLMLTAHPLWVLLAVVPGLIGWWALGKATRAVERDPVGSLALFAWGQLLPYALATGVSALLIFLAVWFAPPDGPEPAPGAPKPPANPLDPYFSEILKAIAGGLSAFLTAAFIKSSEDPDGWVATNVERTFKERFGTKFEAGSDADRAVKSAAYNGSGWDADGRRKRATAIAAALSKP